MVKAFGNCLGEWYLLILSAPEFLSKASDFSHSFKEVFVYVLCPGVCEEGVIPPCPYWRDLLTRNFVIKATNRV